MTKNLRLREARHNKRMTQEELADKIGSFPSYIAALEGSKGYGIKTAIKLAEALGVSADWLLKGDNPYIKNGNIDVTATNINQERKGVPYYNLQMMATITESFNDIREQPEFYVDLEPLNDCTAYVQIYGDSMLPEYKSGMIVAVKQLTNINIIQWGETYLVITNTEANNMRAIKNLYQCDVDPASITLRSTNPLFAGDTVIPRTSVISLHLVKGSVRINHL